jgi:zinc protease
MPRLLHRKRLRLILSLAVWLFTFVAHASPLGLIAQPTEAYRLPNGLRVLIQEDHSTPTAACVVVYRRGAGDNDPSRAGLAHLLEHLMFEDTEHTDAATQAALFERIGGTQGARTDFDLTEYYSVTSADQLEAQLWLHSERMGFLLGGLSAESLANAKTEVLNERSQRVDNSSDGPALERLFQVLYPVDHPYHLLGFGTAETVRAITEDDIAHFYLGHYSPANATLVIVGDVRVGETRSLVEKYFRSLPARSATKLEARASTARRPKQSRRVEMEVDAPHTMLTYAWALPGFNSSRPAFDLAAIAYGEGRRSLLHEALVDDEALAKWGTCWFVARRWSSVFACQIALRSDADLAMAERRFREILTGQKLDFRHLSAAKRKWQSIELRRAEVTLDRARTMGWYSTYSQKLTAWEDDISAHMSLTFDAFKSTIERALRPDDAVVIVAVSKK